MCPTARLWVVRSHPVQEVGGACWLTNYRQLWRSNFDRWDQLLCTMACCKTMLNTPKYRFHWMHRSDLSKCGGEKEKKGKKVCGEIGLDGVFCWTLELFWWVMIRSNVSLYFTLVLDFSGFSRKPLWRSASTVGFFPFNWLHAQLHYLLNLSKLFYFLSLNKLINPDVFELSDCDC